MCPFLWYIIIHTLLHRVRSQIYRPTSVDPAQGRALRDEHCLRTSFHSIELNNKRKPRYDHLKFWRFCEFRTILVRFRARPHQKSCEIRKNVESLNARILASFWARDSSKKAFCRFWLALSNAMKSAGNARRVVHVQCDWKLCTCTARAN